MEHFLKVVAQGYRDRYRDLSHLTFVMPNKRSGSFLLKEFRNMSVQAVIAPRIIAISDFIADNAEGVVDSRLDLIFRLFRCYKALPESSADMTFERFTSWGETLLGDFNEVDMQMVDVDELFKNITDLNFLKSNFFTEEHRRVMVDYFGHSPDIIDVNSDRLWKNFNPGSPSDKDGGDIRGKFVSFWELLLPLYRSFKADLKNAGLTTSGGAYREVASALEEGKEPYCGDKLVFVGFNALSTSERTIFRALKGMTVDLGLGEESKADFIWDHVSSHLVEDEDPSVRFINLNSGKDNFPSPDWISPYLKKARPTKLPELEVIAVPSNVMQVKVASEELIALRKSISEEEIRDARVAVILPDENLLLPLLYSLPDDYQNPNLTMGFPLKHTAVISFAALLRRLHRRSREKEGQVEFLFEDVRDLLAHPYSFILFPRDKIKDFIDECEDSKRFMVSSQQLSILGDNAGEVFVFIGAGTTPPGVAQYIRNVLLLVKTGMLEQNDTFIRTTVEKTYIDTYIDALVRLENCLSEFNVEVDASTVFLLADKLISGETVAFEGEPLQGLQVMGVLETRCLDFDRIIMLSVNEKVMPRVGRNASFIPNFLRGWAGMPPANYQEELFAYYFYRILGRCSKGILTYDSRSSNVRTAGPSRYLLQMKYLLEPGAIKEREKIFGMPDSSLRKIEFDKKPPLLQSIERFEKGSHPAKENGMKEFSASSLSRYLNCPLEFMYRYILGIKVDKERIESIDAVDLGSIVHESMEHLYIRNEKDRRHLLNKPVVITEDYLKGLLSERNERGELLIESVAKDRILEVHFHEKDQIKRQKAQLRGSAAIIFEEIVNYIKDIIHADLQQAPFRIWGCEIEHKVDLSLSNGKKVRAIMVIDRLDQKIGNDGHAPFRIVDYKTGRVKLKAEGLNDIFNAEPEAKNIFQLVFYANLLNILVEKGDLTLPKGIGKKEFMDSLEFVIYDIPNIRSFKPENPKSNSGIVKPSIGGQTIDSIGRLAAEERNEGKTFMQLLDAALCELLDPEVPFSAEPSEQRCCYCDYKLHCEFYSAAAGS